MRRREFIALIGGAAVPWPLAARAQQPTMPVIGFLNSASPQEWNHLVAAFRQGLKDTGFVEGDNVTIEYRWAQGRYDRLPELAADLVGRRVAVIVSSGGDVSTWAAKAATTTIPIVFIVGNDPVQTGLVARLNRPEGNLTGVTIMGALLNVKRLEILREVVPRAEVIGALINPNSARADSDTTEILDTARSVGQQLEIVHAASENDFGPAFAALAERGAKALLVTADPMFVARSEGLVALAARYALPAIYTQRQTAAAGGLMSYGTSLSDMYRQLGTYVGRILSGAKPVDLPVQQPVKFEFGINMKTAKTLGLTFPLPLSGRADEVIE
jgi:putative tryptophan/tyrosine transport system substrate-binding protein